MLRADERGRQGGPNRDCFDSAPVVSRGLFSLKPSYVEPGLRQNRPLDLGCEPTVSLRNPCSLILPGRISRLACRVSDGANAAWAWIVDGISTHNSAAALDLRKSTEIGTRDRVDWALFYSPAAMKLSAMGIARYSSVSWSVEMYGECFLGSRRRDSALCLVLGVLTGLRPVSGKEMRLGLIPHPPGQACPQQPVSLEDG